MKKPFFQTDIGKIVKTVIEIIVIAGVILVASFLIGNIAVAEDSSGWDSAWVICKPGDRVNIRSHPNSRSEICGYLDPEDHVWTDGKKKGGFVHIVDVSNETGQGWVHSGFIVWDKPEFVNQEATIVSRGRLAARKYVGGRRTRWLKPGAKLKVYYASMDWCVTNCGYVQTRYLELEGY